MRKSTRLVLSLAATGALLGLPATGLAHPGQGEAKSQAKSQNGKGKTKRCAKTPSVGYSVNGTLVSFVADDPNTPASEATVTLTVTNANKHARESGELTDMDAAKKGVQVAGGTYTVPAGDAFVLKLDGYEGADTPSPGDAVHVTGKIARTKKKCAADGTSTADRYATPDVRRVTISDRDPDA